MRIAIVDDHELVIQALVAWFAQAAPDLTIVYAGPDPVAAHGVAPDLDALLLDLDLGPQALDSATVVQSFRDCGVPVLIVSAVGEQAVIHRALLAGASGYVPKRESGQVLLEALQAVMAGESYVSADLAAAMLEFRDDSLRPDLSPQELTAMRHYASGLKLDSVARRMNVSRNTAKEYVDRVRRKYEEVGREARTKTELYRRAIEDGHLS